MISKNHLDYCLFLTIKHQYVLNKLSINICFSKNYARSRLMKIFYPIVLTILITCSITACSPKDVGDYVKDNHPMHDKDKK